MFLKLGGAVATAALLVAAAPAVAQIPGPPITTVTADVTVSPNVAGTPKQPQGVKLSAHIELTTPGDGEKPIAQRATVLVPKGAKFNGGKYPKCSLQTMARKGVSACPSKSIMGKGTAMALADTVKTYPTVTVVNVSQKQVCFWTVLTNPARVSACIVGNIKERTGKWSYEVSGTVPQNLQVVAGVPIAVQTIDISGGGKPWAKDWLASTYCPPNGRWEYEAEVGFDNGTTSRLEDSVACRSRR